MQLRVHNTLTRTKEVFEPADPERVRMYVCGPTVYQRIHVGNARAFVVFDVLYRLLRHLYGADNVVYVRNITDIDDKIMEQARKNGESIRALTDRTTADFRADLAALGCLPPTHEPRATEHVPGMIALIATLIERGHAYAADGHVLFNVPSMPAYGRLSRRDREEQIAGARVDVAPYKRDPADFVLWKPSVGDQPGWDSPWGHGRPGWHIECSAMSEAFLGPLPFDLHAGGLDLIFPHHENEIAQSCCAHGIDTMARYWMHNGFLDMRGEKMSKSLGNVIRVSDAIGLVPGEAVRYLLLGAHYRQPLECSEDALVNSDNLLGQLYGVLHSTRTGNPGHSFANQPLPEILDALCDDLNMPLALGALRRSVNELNKMADDGDRGILAQQILDGAWLLGVLQGDPEGYRQRRHTVVVGSDKVRGLAVSAEEIASEIAARRYHRKRREFDKADEVRARLQKLGIILEDRPDGTTDWRRA